MVDVNVSRSSTLVFLATTGSTVVAFLGMTYFARTLGATQIGVFVLFQASVTMLAIFGDFGVGTGVEKQMSERDGRKRRETFSTALAFYLLTTPALAGVILLFRRPINDYIGAPVAHLLAVVLVAFVLYRFVINALKGELRVGETAALELTKQMGWVVFGALLVWVGLRAEALIYGLLAGLLLALAWGLQKLDTETVRPTVDRARSLLAFARHNFVPTVGLVVHNWMDVVIIGLFLTQAAVGAYEMAWKLAGVTTLLASAIGTSLLPQTSAWDADGERGRIEEMMTRAITPSVFLVIPAFFGVLVLAPELLGLLFGAEFTIAAVALVILVAGKVPEALQMLVGRCLLGLGQPRLVARATVYTVVLNLALNLLLVPRFGLVGAAVATTVSFVVGLGFRVRYLSRLIDLRVPVRDLGWCTFAAGVMAATLLGLEAVILVDSLPRLLGLVGFAAAIYVSIVLSSRTFRRQAVEYKNSVFS